MDIPNGYKGNVNFYWCVSLEFLSAAIYEREGPDYVFLGSVDADVAFDSGAIVAKAVDALNQQIEIERARSIDKIQKIKDQIATLTCLEDKSNG